MQQRCQIFLYPLHILRSGVGIRDIVNRTLATGSKKVDPKCPNGSRPKLTSNIRSRHSPQTSSDNIPTRPELPSPRLPKYNVKKNSQSNLLTRRSRPPPSDVLMRSIFDSDDGSAERKLLEESLTVEKRPRRREEIIKSLEQMNKGRSGSIAGLATPYKIEAEWKLSDDKNLIDKEEKEASNVTTCQFIDLQHPTDEVPNHPDIPRILLTNSEFGHSAANVELEELLLSQSTMQRDRGEWTGSDVNANGTSNIGTQIHCVEEDRCDQNDIPKNHISSVFLKVDSVDPKVIVASLANGTAEGDNTARDQHTIDALVPARYPVGERSVSKNSES